MARLRTLVIHENSAYWDVHVDIWLWHGGNAFLRTQIRYRLVMKLNYIIHLGKYDFGWLPKCWVCVCCLSCGHHWFHVVFFVCKGSNNRQAGGGKRMFSIAFDLLIQSTKNWLPRFDMDCFTWIIQNVHKIFLWLFVWSRTLWVIWLYNVYDLYIIYIYIIYMCVRGDSNLIHCHVRRFNVILGSN